MRRERVDGMADAERGVGRDGAVVALLEQLWRSEGVSSTTLWMERMYTTDRTIA
jgi:hypothetical protein